MEEEKNAQGLLRDAEEKAEAILRDAKVSAAAIVGKAESDDTLVKELTERYNERIAELRGKILAEGQARVVETEKLGEMNMEAAVSVIVDRVLGVGLEQ